MLAERIALPNAFAKVGFDPSRVIFCTGAPAAEDCAAMARCAYHAGYVNFLVLPPFYYKSLSDDGLYAFYARLIESLGRDGLRVHLSHFPQMSGVPLSLELVTRLKSDFGSKAQTAFLAPQGTERDKAMANVTAARAVARKYPLMAAMKKIEDWATGDEICIRMGLPPIAFELGTTNQPAVRSGLT
ncbi:MAG: dihydrodipicolinate synthase family protein [Roseobacter sp.]